MADSPVDQWYRNPANPDQALYDHSDGSPQQVFNNPSPAAKPDAEGNLYDVDVLGTGLHVNSKALYGGIQGFKNVTLDPAGRIGTFTNQLAKAAGYGMDQLRQAYPNASPEELSSRQNDLIGQSQKDLFEANQAKAVQPRSNTNLNDLITGKPHERTWGEFATTPGDWVPGLVGGALGSVADPFAAVPLGKFGTGLGAIAKRAGLAGLLYGTGDVVGQEAAIRNKAQDQFDPMRAIETTLMGAGVQTLFEVTPFVKGLFQQRGFDTNPSVGEHANPIIDPQVDHDSRVAAAKQVAQFVGGKDADGVPYTDQFIRDYANQHLGPNHDIEGVLKYRADNGSFTPAIEERGAKPAQDSFTFNEPKPGVSIGDQSNRMAAAEAHINDLTQNWTNRPEVQLHENFKHLPVDQSAIGMYGDDGTVHINMQNVDGPATLTSALYHESLGHHGLAQKFGDELTGKMEDLYDNGSDKFKASVDKWTNENPGYYDEGTPNQKALAVEEVLAKRSEKGPETASLLDKLTSTVQDFGRKIGIDSKFSSSEIQHILAMSHDATMNGDPAGVIPNGFRYEKAQVLTPADEEHQFVRHTMADGSKINTLVDKNGVVLDTMDHRGPNGSYLPEDIKPSIIDVMTDKNFKYSKLEQAEVVDDKARSVRLHMPEGDIPHRERILTASNLLKDVPEGKTGFIQPFKELPDYHRFSHPNAEGEPVSGSYHVHPDTGNIDGFSIGMGGKANRIGTTEVRNIAKAIKEQHPGAESIEGFRITGARKEAGAAAENVSVSLMKYMKGAEKNPKFEAWYEGSKVRDEEGKPIVLYHGTSKDTDFKSFNMNRRGVWMTEDPHEASAFAKDNDSKGLVHNSDGPNPWSMKEKNTADRVMPIYADIKNPKTYRVNELRDATYALGGENYAKGEAALFNKLKVEGYDGVKLEQANGKNIWVAIDHPSQLKSASGNNGEFNGNKTDLRYMKTASGQPHENVGSINPNKIDTVHDIDEILHELHGVNGSTGKISWEDTEASALARGLTPSRIAKRKGFGEPGELTSYIRASNIALTQQLEKVAALSHTLETEGFSDKIHEQALQAFATLKAIHARVNGDNSELGRALNILKKVSSSKEAAGSVLDAMGDHVLTNPEDFKKFMKEMAIDLKTGNDSSAIRRISDAFKPSMKDTIFRVWYNMLLSNPPTHVANIVSTGANVLADVLEKTGASAIGQVKRFKNEDGSWSLNSDQDRVRMREVAYRIQGVVKGLTDAQTYRNTRESLNSGLTGNKDNAKTGNAHAYQGDNPLVGLTSGFLESPTRALAAADEWWRNVLQASNMHGLAVRNAGNKGLTGAAYRNEVANLLANPTKEMIDATNDFTKVIQFLDKPSKLASAVQNAQRSKPGDALTTTVGRGMLQTVFPFTSTPDSLIRTALRRSPLGAFERENINGWSAGGAEKDQVTARMTIAGLATAYIAALAYSGATTGGGPSNSNKRAEWAQSHQPNSIKVNGKYISVQGLEPLSTNVIAVSTLVEQYKAGEMSHKDFTHKVASAIFGVTGALEDNSWTQGFTQLGTAVGKDQNAAATAFTNWAKNTASSMVVPAIMRGYATSVDQKQRDTTGDGTTGDQIVRKIEAGVPDTPLTRGFNSTLLPQKADILGNKLTKESLGHETIGGASNMTSHLTERDPNPTNDPVAKEIARLGDANPATVILGQPKRTDVAVNGVKTNLTASQFEMYQKLSGHDIKEYIAQQLKTPEWKAMTDQEKIKDIRKTATDMRQSARNYLFPAAVATK